MGTKDPQTGRHEAAFLFFLQGLARRLRMEQMKYPKDTHSNPEVQKVNVTDSKISYCTFDQQYKIHTG